MVTTAVKETKGLSSLFAKKQDEKNTALSEKELQDLVVESDTGSRNPRGIWAGIITAAALMWALFQLWVASPLPFFVAEHIRFLDVLVLNDTKARYLHLTFALFLAFLAYPAFRQSPRRYIPLVDIIFALLGAFSALYLFVFYEDLTLRVGMPTNVLKEIAEGRFVYEGFFATIGRFLLDDVLISIVGILLLLEATRRALGPPLMIIAIVFLFYTIAGSYEFIPEVIRHKGQSLEKIANHQWLTSEGVFGVALGVSTSFVFLFVLFGSLLDKAGAGNYFIKVAFSLLGHLRGGPAKAAVLSSGMTGLVSGSSIANVVTTGTFTVPLMRRVGFTREKAGAVEVASSVNGQIMPPVMGAAAFLMVEYVGISYTEVVKHAFLPAIISYIALVYIVHLEAVKADMEVLKRAKQSTLVGSLISFGIVASSIIILSWLVYHGVGWVKDVFPNNASLLVALGILGAYVGLLYYQSRYPELGEDDHDKPLDVLPETGPTVKSGLHFLLPIVVLVWCLMVERLSPGLSAFWAVVLIMFILLTQRPIKAFFRGGIAYSVAFKEGCGDLYAGLIAGARNMVGIGVATAAAGIVVGSVSLTGVGQVLTEVIEIISGGSLILILLFTALICLILGMGLPTTANYIVVASLMASVIVELGAQNGLIVPLIAVHLFVFYFGIMADVTPPVGLASFAAAAVSGGDPIRTGLQAFFYSIRTVILPFFFIFNTELLLIGVDSVVHGSFVFVIATVAILLFAASTQGYFIVRSKWYESLGLLLVAFTLFVPNFWIDRIVPPFKEVSPLGVADKLGAVAPGEQLRLNVSGQNNQGYPRDIVVTILVKEGDVYSGADRLRRFGLILSETPDGKVFVQDAMFNSMAEKSGVDIDLALMQGFDYEITSVGVRQEQPNARLMYIPALVLLVLIIWSQRRRKSELSAVNGRAQAV